MSQVIILNGPAGVGKTTIAATLASRLPGTVSVAGDDIRHFSPADARTHLGPGSTYRAGGALVNAYLAMNAPRVLFNYIFTEPGHVGAFCRALAPTAPIYLITVWAPLEIVRHREATRLGRAPLGAQVVETYLSMETRLNELGHIVGNTGQPEETADRILAIMSIEEPVPASRFAALAA